MRRHLRKDYIYKVNGHRAIMLVFELALSSPSVGFLPLPAGSFVWTPCTLCMDQSENENDSEKWEEVRKSVTMVSVDGFAA